MGRTCQFSLAAASTTTVMGELVSSPLLPHLLQSDQNLSVLPCCRIYYSQIRTCQFSLAATSTTVRSELVSSPWLPHLLQSVQNLSVLPCCRIYYYSMNKIVLTVAAFVLRAISVSSGTS